MKVSSLLKTRVFWVFVVLMLCTGSAELAVSQWASAFAESGLKVSKTPGDLLGPCLFAVCMGLARVLFAKFGAKLHIRPALMIAAAVCTAGYALCAFAPQDAAWLGLAGCGVVGFSVGIMWPGTFSFASAGIPKGGTALFALLALAGDVGCMAGPTAVGAIADVFGGDLHVGLAFGMIVPVVMFVVAAMYREKKSIGQTE